MATYCLVAKSRLALSTPWTVALQAPLSVGFSRQEYWSGFPFPLLGDLPSPGIELASPALAGGFFTKHWVTREVHGSLLLLLSRSSRV